VRAYASSTRHGVGERDAATIALEEPLADFFLKVAHLPA
jgi:hypothetical protein